MIARRAFLACAAAGVTALAGEWLPPRPAPAPGPQAASVSAPPKPPARPHALIAADATAILQRPLFAPSRHPAQAPASHSRHAANLPRLAGIVVAPNYRRAIFEGAGHAQLTLAESNAIGDWRITRIAAESVSLVNGDSQLQLSPAFLNAPIIVPIRDNWTTPAPTGLLRARWANPQLQP